MKTYYNSFQKRLPTQVKLKESAEVKSPKKHLYEMTELKKSLNESQKLKSENNFLSKRNRLLKNNWKHGIVGVDNVDNPRNEIYKQLKAQKQPMEVVKERRAKARLSNLIR